MSNAAINAVFTEKTTSGSMRLVLLVLADMANDQLQCWPSIDTISKRANLDRRYVIRILKKLEVSGLIQRVHRWDEEKNQNQSNIYKLELVVVDRPLGSGQEATRGSVPEATKGSGQEATQTLNNNQYKRTAREPITLQKSAKDPELGLFILAKVLSEVSGLSFEANKARIFKEAKLLSKDPSATPEKIKIDYAPGGAWYSCDWRGQKGQAPTLEQVRSTFGTLTMKQAPVIPKRNTGFDTSRNTIMQSMQEEVISGY